MPNLIHNLKFKRGISCALLLLAFLFLAACGEQKQHSPVNGGTGSLNLVPDSDAPPITAATGTALHHAQMCAQYLGPIPAMSCSDAAVVPITVNGVEVSETPATCDRPSALTGTCEAGERISARYMGSYHNGLSRPEVTFVNFCRDGGMGVIGHNSETGATCFFHKSDTFPNDVVHPGSDDPDSNYDQYWQTPKVVAADNCQGCHQADPWIHSPWINQLRDPNDPSQPLIPVTASKEAPYVVVGDDFAQPYHQGAPDNSCTSCHKPQCDNQFAVKLGELSMPGPFTDYHNFIGVTPDLQELRDWCTTIPSGGFTENEGGHNNDDSEGENAGSEEQSDSCDSFFNCSEACAPNDYACANACATNNLEEAELSSTQPLLNCMEALGCALGGDEACITQYCNAEFESFDQVCSGPVEDESLDSSEE